MAIAFKGQNVGGDAVEEEAVMADDHGATGKISQSLFQRAQGVDVEIIGRLVQQQQVGTSLQHFGEMDAVALTTRQHPHLLLLVRTLEVEGGAIAARIDFALAKLDQVITAGNLFPNRLLAIKRVTRLVDIAKLDTLANLDRAGIRFFLTRNHPEQSGLARAVRPDNADDAARWQAK